LTDFDIIAREVSGYRTRFEAIEKRLVEVEKVNARLEDAALITARALQEISGHWNAVCEAMRRRDESQLVAERDYQGQAYAAGATSRARLSASGVRGLSQDSGEEEVSLR